MMFAMDASALHGQSLPLYDELRNAGDALCKYLDTLRSAPIVLSHTQQQHLMQCCQKHLVNCERCGVAYTPEHHLFVHMTVRTANTHPLF